MSSQSRKKPIGILTRGKTASNRLRRVDNFVLLYEPGLISQSEGLFVDLGYGFDPRTTLESAARFRRVNPSLRVLGVEIDPERVAAAQPYADEITEFRLGGFNLPLRENESTRLIRAFNVLRQYEENDFLPAYERLAQYVQPRGLMIEGTSTPFGQIWSANVARKTNDGWDFEALVFSANFHLGFDVGEFQTVLPKNYIHRVVEGEAIYDFFAAWKQAAAKTSAAKTFGLKRWFIASAQRLAELSYNVRVERKWLSKGYLIWKF
jgi:hypothetical protein